MLWRAAVRKVIGAIALELVDEGSSAVSVSSPYAIRVGTSVGQRGNEDEPADGAG